jgi:histidine ammonia-lyase
VLAIELLCAAQGLDYLAPLKPGRRVAEAHARVREYVPHMEHDEVLSDRIAALIPVVLELGRDDDVA